MTAETSNLIDYWRINMKKWLRAYAALAILAGLFTLTVANVSAAPLRGAIFTTTPDGGIVNENVHYTSKLEV
jgi:hypothetical protein